MNERTRKILILIGLVISSVYVIFQLFYFFEVGPSGIDVLAFPLIAILIMTILLSRNYIKEFFKERKVWIFCLAFIVLALVLDNFYEIAFQLGIPIHPILCVDLIIRLTFFLPWILMWLALFYYFDFSLKSTFYLGALQGIIIEYLLVFLYSPESHRILYYITNMGYFSLIVIPFDIIVCILLYGCNIAVPYTPFREIFKERLEQREIKPKYKYMLSLLPVIAFPLAMLLLDLFVFNLIVAILIALA